MKSRVRGNYCRGVVTSEEKAALAEELRAWKAEGGLEKSLVQSTGKCEVTRYNNIIMEVAKMAVVGHTDETCWETCDECNGDKVVECPTCYGDMVTICPSCDGRECEECDMTGEVFCELCFGAGDVPCEGCGGYGNVQVYCWDSEDL